MNIVKRITNHPLASGILLIVCVIISLLIANSGLGARFQALLDHPLGVQNEALHLRYSVAVWINDGLMAIFFLLVGLEIKKELVAGQLSTLKKASLPFFAAIGGVVVPACIYIFFNTSTPYESGWAIPMATDIAFALAVIGMLQKAVPTSLKIFLAALAIVDDLMAIIVIAIFYTTSLHFASLLIALGIFALMLLLNKLNVRYLAVYLILGAFVWYFIHQSGIHATIAGVLTAFAIPLRVPKSTHKPLETLEHAIHKPVNFMIMPLFALANTNIVLELDLFHGLLSTLGLGIILGLVIGKPVGVFFMTLICVKLKLCKMPDYANWLQILGVGMLAGIGFTMSIFVAGLSFSKHPFVLSEAKVAVLLASIVSAILGASFLLLLHRLKVKSRLKAILPRKLIR